MAIAGKRSLGSNNPVYEIDLKAVFGGGDLPSDSSFYQGFAQAVLEKIRNRTQDQSVDVNGKEFPKYSESYKKSIEFRAFGKSSKVDLTLTGDMLGLMDLIEVSDQRLKFGWDDSTQAAKAHGHITGNVGKKRDFFGLQKQELDEIKQEFLPFVREYRAAARRERLEILESINQDNLTSFIDSLTNDLDSGDI